MFVYQTVIIDQECTFDEKDLKEVTKEIKAGKNLNDLIELNLISSNMQYDCESEQPLLLDNKPFMSIFDPANMVNTPLVDSQGGHTQKGRLSEIADRLAEVRTWMEIPEETSAGITAIIDDLNSLINDMRS